MAKAFSTLDIYLASFLSYHKLDPGIEIRNGKVIFVFNSSDSLYRLMNDYNSNVPVDVADFVTVIKTLRGKMLSAKEGVTGYGKGYGHGSIRTNG